MSYDELNQRFRLRVLHDGDFCDARAMLLELNGRRRSEMMDEETMYMELLNQQVTLYIQNRIKCFQAGGVSDVTVLNFLFAKLGLDSQKTEDVFKLADKLGLIRAYLFSCVHGGCVLDREAMARLAEHCEVPIDVFNGPTKPTEQMFLLVKDDARTGPTITIEASKAGYGASLMAYDEHGRELGEVVLDYHDNKLQALVFGPNSEDVITNHVFTEDVRS